MDLTVSDGEEAAPSPAPEQPQPQPEPEQCVICLEELQPGMQLKCEEEDGWSHTRCCKRSYHYLCLSKWLAKNGDEVDCPNPDGSTYQKELEANCPTCKAKIPNKSKMRMMRSS